MKRLPALTCSISLFVLSLLTACSDNPSKHRVAEQPPTTVIEQPVPAYLPVDKKLTDPIPEPALPAQLCTYLGHPAWCVLDGLLWNEDWRTALQQANADRATTATVTRPPVKP